VAASLWQGNFGEVGQGVAKCGKGTSRNQAEESPCLPGCSFSHKYSKIPFLPPKIADAQLFGVRENKFGEELCAWMKLKLGESAADEESRAFCCVQIAHQKSRGTSASSRTLR